MTNRPDHVLIRRTGQPSLRLAGVVLAASASSHTDGPGRNPTQNRWHELELWTDDRTIQGPEQPHCVVVRYVTRWDGELGHDFAEIVPRKSIGDVLRSHDPTEHLAGFPAGAQYEPKQETLRRSIRNGYAHAVSDILDAAKVWEIGTPGQIAEGAGASGES